MDTHFVIGDVHGHIETLKELLFAAGLMDKDENRLRPEVQITQLGDLGQFDYEAQYFDKKCYELAIKMDMRVLWGNHDRAVISDQHRFRGYCEPDDQMKDLMEQVNPQNAACAGEYLLTHAGLSPTYVEFISGCDNVKDIASALNVKLFDTIVDAAIGIRRGGYDPTGGILWRDADEPLWNGVPQIFGHTRGDVRQYGTSYCIDTASKCNGSLVGMWLPSKQLVVVGPEKDTLRMINVVY
jgi:hypothetical protein